MIFRQKPGKLQASMLPILGKDPALEGGLLSWISR